MKKRLLSLLLALILVLGVLPGGIWEQPAVQAAEAADEAAPASIKVDFKEFAKKAAQQDFWANLAATSKDTIRYAGSVAYTTPMPASVKQAYDDMRAWLAENANWNINESKSQIANMWYCQAVYVNADESLPWGLCFRPRFHDPASNRMVLDVTVPEGAAGEYRLELDIFRENINSPHYCINSSPGGGYADI